MFTFPALALTPAESALVDQLIRDRRIASAKVSPAQRDLVYRIDELEKRMLPVVFTFNRIGPIVIQRLAELDQLAVFLQDPKNTINPYDDANWVEEARKQTAYVCCDVRRSPRLAQEIQENLAKGLPALSDGTAGAVAERALRASKGTPVNSEPPEPADQAEPTRKERDRTPLPGLPGKPSSASGPAKKPGSGIISGLPQPSAPAPAPVVADGAAPAPGAPPPTGATPPPQVPPPPGTVPPLGPDGRAPPPPGPDGQAPPPTP